MTPRCEDTSCPAPEVDTTSLLWAVVPGVLLVAFAAYVVLADAVLLLVG